MEDEQIIRIFDQLKNGEIQEYYVNKEDFLDFRRILVKREDFKHYQGIARRGGDVLYRYLDQARS
jgi:hypothetical protein